MYARARPPSHLLSLSMSGLIRKVMEDWLEEQEEMILAKSTEEADVKWEKEGKKTISQE